MRGKRTGNKSLKVKQKPKGPVKIYQNAGSGRFSTGPRLFSVEETTGPWLFLPKNTTKPTKITFLGDRHTGSCFWSTEMRNFFLSARKSMCPTPYSDKFWPVPYGVMIFFWVAENQSARSRISINFDRSLTGSWFFFEWPKFNLPDPVFR